MLMGLVERFGGLAAAINNGHIEKCMRSAAAKEPPSLAVSLVVLVSVDYGLVVVSVKATNWHSEEERFSLFLCTLRAFSETHTRRNNHKKELDFVLQAWQSAW